ncbi:MAG TPA: histidine phosphatase family protein [Ignavibacteriales bacterium]|nr:histidine phosphatase family protein [Ignavibacteriales bacterium]HEX3072626.1 histidine phosphatase family protein [Ignavibacteriales bacterium]
MKDLIVARHAKSSWKFADIPDFDRPLNQRGNRDAPFMGKLLNKMNVKPEIIISSPANRAISTAQALAHEMNYPIDQIIADKKIYEATEKDMLDAASKIDNKYNVALIVGHNPALTYFVEHLTGENIGNMPTGGVVYINLHIDNWNELTGGIGKIKFFEFPKKYFQ